MPFISVYPSMLIPAALTHPIALASRPGRSSASVTARSSARWGIITRLLSSYAMQRSNRACRLRRNPQQLARVSAEDRFLVGVPQERRIENEIDADRPVEGIVRSVHHLPDARLRD